MPNFADLFAETMGQPIIYGGKTLHLVDKIEFHGQIELDVSFESTDSQWRQGIVLRTKGTIDVNGMTIKNKPVVLWEDTAPPIEHIRVASADGVLWVKNVWSEDGSVESWVRGAAMIFEDIGDTRRYHCNDGEPDDDFDDLVFRITWRGRVLQSE